MTKFLLLLIVVTMLFTGINQIFINHDNVVAKVGSKKISQEDYQRLYEHEKNNLQNLFGSSLSEEQITALGIKRVVLERLVQDQLLNNLIDNIGMNIGDESVIAAIKTIPNFHDENAKFSKEKFLEILHDNNVDEKQYISSLKEALMKEMLLKFLQYSPMSYQKVAELLYKYRYEQRVVTLKTLLPTMVKDLPKATAEELQDFYQSHKNDFWAPEYRQAQYIHITKDHINTNISIATDDVVAQLKDLEERWNIGYFVNPDKESADKLYDEMRRINKRPSDMPGYKKMDNVSINMLPEDLRDILKLPEADFTKPRKVNSSFYIFYIDKKYTISAKEKEELEQAIKKQLTNEAINKRLEDLVLQMEEKLSSGTTIQDLAKIYNLKIEELGPVDIASTPRDQRPLIEAIFLDANNNTFVEMENQDGISKYYYINTLKVIPSKLQEFDECRQQVEKLWKAEATNKKLYELAVDKSLKLAGTEETIFRTQVANVEAPKQDYPASFVAEIFNLKVNESTKPIEYKAGKIIIAQLKAIKPAAKNKVIVEQVSEEIKKMITEAMYSEFKDYLYEKFPVQVNEKLIG